MEGFRSYREPVEVRFEPGANVFHGRNEAGKTGILLAVQAALYPPRLASEREALASDGSDVCRVGLEYELPDGRRVCVTRDLLNHKGSIAEWRNEGWQVLATAVGDVAQHVRDHTGCDEALFRATLLVRHEGIEIGDADDLTRSLSERIEVLVSGSPGGVSAARAVRKLEAEVKGLSGPRAGHVALAEASLREAESALASARSRARRLEDARPRLEDLSRRTAELERELKEGQVVLERARRAAGLAARRAAIVKERASIDATLDARAALARLEAERAALPAAGDPRPPRRSSLRPLLIVLAALLELGGMALVLGGWLLAGLGVMVATFAAGAAASYLGRSTAVAPVKHAEEAPADPGQRPETTELVADRARLGRDLDEAEAAIATATLQLLAPADLTRLEIRAGQLPDLVRAAYEARIRCEVELNALEAEGAPLAELEDEAAVAGRAVERLKLRQAAMELARKELQGAIEDIRLGVGPELAAEASRLLASVAPSYSVVLKEGLAFTPAGAAGEELGRRQLSDGTADQFFFAVRVALAGVLLGDLRPPLLLDDPFRYADDGRRESLHAMLEAIAAERQVLYFTVDDPSPLAVTHRLPVVASRAGAE